MKKLQNTFLEIEGQPIPAKIYQEYRNNVRVSIGKTAAILRLPIQMDKKQKKVKFSWFTRWVEKQFEGNEVLKKRFFPPLWDLVQPPFQSAAEHLTKIKLNLAA